MIKCFLRNRGNHKIRGALCSQRVVGAGSAATECRRCWAACSKETAKNMLLTRAPNWALSTGRLRAHKQITKLSSSLGLSPSNSILPHSIADQLQETKGCASKDDLPRLFGGISAEVTLDSRTGTFQLNIEQRLQCYLRCQTPRGLLLMSNTKLGCLLCNCLHCWNPKNLLMKGLVLEWLQLALKW